MIQITSYKSINRINFEASESDIIACFGQPIHKGHNREKEQEFDFGDFILRLDSVTGKLRECTLVPNCDGAINGHLIIWSDDFLAWLILEDPNLMEVLGFLVSLKLGIAISGFHDGDESQKAIHAFRYGDWDLLQNRMRKFKK